METERIKNLVPRPARWLLVAVAAVWLLAAGQLQAQSWVTPYQPARPALSPYLYLNTPNYGGFPNYQAFVRPLQQQSQANYNQRTAITRLQRDVAQQQQAQYAPAGVAPTGARSTYNDLSHYYPGAPTRTPSRPSSGRAAPPPRQALRYALGGR